jgi:hypothetical protein
MHWFGQRLKLRDNTRGYDAFVTVQNLFSQCENSRQSLVDVQCQLKIGSTVTAALYQSIRTQTVVKWP